MDKQTYRRSIYKDRLDLHKFDWIRFDETRLDKTDTSASFLPSNLQHIIVGVFPPGDSIATKIPEAEHI